jgi:hypothetical protein
MKNLVLWTKEPDDIPGNADKNCQHCDGTGFITYGWARGLVCACVDKKEKENENRKSGAQGQIAP